MEKVKTKSEKIPKKKDSTFLKKGNILIIGIAVILLLATVTYAVLSKDSTNPNASNEKSMTLNEVRAMIDAKYSGMGTEATKTPPVVNGYKPILSPKTVGKFPDYVYANAMTLRAYTFATEHPEILEQIPCYCNCAMHGSTLSGGKPHKSLRDCFINDNGQYDDHASYCDTCVGEALMVEQYLST